MSEIVRSNGSAFLVLPAEFEPPQHVPSRHSIMSRLNIFDRWLDETGRDWLQPDLGSYRDKLLGSGLKPESVESYLQTIRSRYNDMLADYKFTERLYAFARLTIDDWGQELTPANLEAAYQMIERRLRNGIDPKNAAVNTTTIQDIPQEDNIRLNGNQVSRLLDDMDISTKVGIRDKAIVAMLFATGIRVSELCDLNVRDLRTTTQDGNMALVVRHGKGNKQRQVPYGDMLIVLNLTEWWMKEAGITSGRVFRGFYPGYKRVRNSITPRAIQMIFNELSVMINGVEITITPIDCRRTYARLCWESGMDLLSIQHNLGHAKPETTELYVGVRGGNNRKTPDIFSL